MKLYVEGGVHFLKCVAAQAPAVFCGERDGPCAGKEEAGKRSACLFFMLPDGEIRIPRTGEGDRHA